MADIDLDRLDTLAQAATQGWRETDSRSADCCVWVTSSSRDWGWIIGADMHETAEYVAACDPETIRALVARVREAEARIAEAIATLGPGARSPRRPGMPWTSCEVRTVGESAWQCPTCPATVVEERAIRFDSSKLLEGDEEVWASSCDGFVLPERLRSLPVERRWVTPWEVAE